MVCTISALALENSLYDNRTFLYARRIEQDTPTSSSRSTAAKRTQRKLELHVQFNTPTISILAQRPRALVLDGSKSEKKSCVHNDH